MANYVKSGKCDHCGSSDAKATYDDGTGYCFSCCKFSGAGITDRIIRKKAADKAIKAIDTTDWQYHIPEVAKLWLDKYEICETEVAECGMRWDAKQSALVMPLRELGKVVCASYRYFNNDGPKSRTFGHRTYQILKPRVSETVVFVEDYVSAIKVSRFLPCVPLLGSSLANDALLKYSKTHQNALYWLDADKVRVSMSLVDKSFLVGLDSAVVFTPRDPKELSDETMKIVLDKHLEMFV